MNNHSNQDDQGNQNDQGNHSDNRNPDYYNINCNNFISDKDNYTLVIIILIITLRT